MRNVWRQFENIKDYFPSDLEAKKVLPYFSDWIQNRVFFVHVIAPDQDMALEIFETMNDRGLRLNNIDMLKSHLLAKSGDEEVVIRLNDLWRRRVTALADIEKNADAEFIKAWLRAHYAETQRERKTKSSPKDFDIIGTAFHKWVREDPERVGLTTEHSYREFIEREFGQLSERYRQLLRASRELTPGLENVYYNAQAGFTLQFLVILAAITSSDDDDLFTKKANLVAGALDIFLVRRMVNYQNFGYSTVVYGIFNLAKSIRKTQKSLPDIAGVLAQWLSEQERKLDGMEHFELTGRNRSHIRYILARIVSLLDSELGNENTFVKYVDRSRRHPYEVEHVLANDFERYSEEFGENGESDFHIWRNRIGGLLLLPKDFNASYGAMPYSEKVKYYDSQDVLARTLNHLAYKQNPTFVRLCKERNLDFKPYKTFGKNEISERSRLYKQLAEIVWDPEPVENMERAELLRKIKAALIDRSKGKGRKGR